MKKEVTLKELLAARIFIVVCIAIYYWMCARSDWKDYYETIQTSVALFTGVFFCLMKIHERKYNREMVDEMASANLKRCDSLCYKITKVCIVAIAFASAILRFTITSEVIGYMLMGVLVVMSVVRAIVFCYMDAKGV